MISKSHRKAMVTLSAAMAVLATVAAAAPSAVAQSKSSVEVVLIQISPQVPKPGDILQISGYVRNAGEADVGPLTVHLERAVAAFQERSTFDAFADGSGERSTFEVLGAQARLDGTIGPGELAPFRIQVPLADLHLGERGVYGLKVAAEGAGTQPEARTYLPWIPHPGEARPTKVVLLWPLVDRPVLGQDRVFADDRLADLVRPNGRLRGLVDAAAGRPVSWVVDPDLIESVEAMSKTYRVRAGGRIVEEAGKDAAGAWLENLRTGTAGQTLLGLPYADADVAALTKARRTPDIAAAAAGAAETTRHLLPGRKVTPVVWPNSGFVDKTAINAISTAGYELAVLSADAFPPDGAEPPNFTPTGAVKIQTTGGTLGGLLADRVLSDVVGQDTRVPGAGPLMVQRILAETAMITLERPNRQRTILIAPPKRWSPTPEAARALVAAYAGTPWIKPTPASELAKTAADVDRRGPVYPARAQRSEVPQKHLAAVASLAKRVTAFSGVLTDSAGLMSEYRTALIRAESSAWANGEGKVSSVGRDYLDELERGFDTERNKVRILSRGTVTLSSSSGTIPVTIANDLDQTVTVQLALRARVSRRLEIHNPAPFRIDGRSRETVEVKADAVANGIVIVDAVLTNPQGDRIGPISQFKVRATDYGQVGFLIIGGAITLLLGSVVVRLVRRRTRPPPPPDPLMADRPDAPKVGV